MQIFKSVHRRSQTPYLMAILLSLVLGNAGIICFSSIISKLGKVYGYFDREPCVMLMSEDKQYQLRMAPETSVLQAWQRSLHSFAGMAGFTIASGIISTQEGAHIWSVALVDPDLFQLMGVTPIAGHSLADFNYQNSEPIIMVTDDLARLNYGSVKQAIGELLIMNGRPYEIIGVVPSAFGERLSPGDRIGAVQALDYTQAESVQVLGKLRRGGTPSSAQAELDAWASAQPLPLTQNGNLHWVVLTQSELMDSRTLRMFRSSIAGSLILLGVMASNIAHLLRVRAQCQRRELATRWALGARRQVLFHWRLKQAIILTLLSVGASAFLARWGLMSMAWTLPEHLGFLAGMKVETSALMASFGISVLILIAFSTLFDMLRTSSQLRHDLGSDQRLGSYLAWKGTFGHLYVITLVAISFILCVASYLLATSMLKLRRIDVGFVVQDLQSVTVTLPAWKFADDSSRRLFVHRLVDTLSSKPQVDSVGVASQPPSKPGVIVGDLEFEGLMHSKKMPSVIAALYIDHKYFRTIQQKLLAGRSFFERESQTGAQVVVVSEATTKFMGIKPYAAIGRSIRIGKERREIVGVVADLHTQGLVRSLRGLEIYLPLSRYSDSMTLLIRTRSGRGVALEEDMRRLDSYIVFEASPMQTVIANSAADTHFLSSVVSEVTLLALLLAFVGVYSTISNFVHLHLGQLALRVALGANQRNVKSWVLWKSVSRCLIGLAVGLVASYPSCRLLDGQLFGIETSSPSARVVAAILVVTSTVFATWLPAARAAQTSPIELLR